MDVTFWGVRGSIAATGPEFNRYGGNTACISVGAVDRDDLLVLDAGTGIIELGSRLMSGRFGSGQGSAVVWLTHSHWDHIQGFPFFSPVYVPGNRVTLYGAARSSGMLQGILEGQMNPHFNPVQSLRNLGAEIAFENAEEGVTETIGEVQITARINPHGGTVALALRLQTADKSLVYAPDAGYIDDEPSEEILELYRGADYLVHDCTYTPEDRKTRMDRGYSSIDIAARVAARCAVGSLVMFHYDQDYTDEDIDELEKRCRGFLDAEPNGDQVELIAAYEGLVLAI